MLHAYERTFAHVRHTQSRLHSGFLIRCPAAMDRQCLSADSSLNVLCDFCTRRAGIGIDTAQTGIDSALCNRLIA